jgi:hypothetical protein
MLFSKKAVPASSCRPPLPVALRRSGDASLREPLNARCASRIEIAGGPSRRRNSTVGEAQFFRPLRFVCFARCRAGIQIGGAAVQTGDAGSAFSP